MRPFMALSFVAATFLGNQALLADEVFTVKLELKDGVVLPQRLEVPAGKPFKLEIRNTGKIAGEFECKPLKKEKVVVAGATAVLTFNAAAAGEYKFVEEFHENLPTGQGLIVAK